MPVLYAPPTDMTTESLTELLRGTVVHTFNNLSSFVSNTVDKITHSTPATPPSIRKVADALKSMSWTEFSDNHMLVPEGLHTDIAGCTKLLRTASLEIFADTTELLASLNNLIHVAAQDRPVNMHLTQVQHDKYKVKQDKFLRELGKYINHSNLSHMPIRKMFDQPSAAIGWYSTAQELFTVDAPAEAAGIRQMLQNTAHELTTYVDYVRQNPTSQTVSMAKQISELALSIADKVDVVAVVALTDMQLRTSAIRFGMQVLNK